MNAKVPAPPMNERALLKKLLELYDLQNKNNANDYDAVRILRREWASTWEQARVLFYGPKAKEPEPVSETQRAAWDKRAKAAAVRRANEKAEQDAIR